MLARFPSGGSVATGPNSAEFIGKRIKNARQRARFHAVVTNKAWRSAKGTSVAREQSGAR